MDATVGKKAASAGQEWSYWLLLAAFVVVLFIGTGAWFYPHNTEGSAHIFPGGRLLSNAMLLIMAACIVMFYRHALFFAKEYALITLLLLIHYISITLSIVPKESFLMCIRLTLFFGFYGVVAVVLERRHIWMVLLWVLGGLMVLSFLYAIALPRYGVMGGHHSGAWRGLLSHKNQFGYLCSYSFLLLGLALLQPYKIYLRAALLFLLMITLFMLVKSHSSGALVNAALGLMLSCVVVYDSRLDPRLKAAMLFIVVLCIFTIIPIWDEFFAAALHMLGRDPSLTNRADIWELYFAEIGRSPWLGLGANAYQFDTAMHKRIMDGLGTGGAISPHNGYLVIALQIGLLGLAVYLLIALRILYAGIKSSFRGSADVLSKLLVVYTFMHMLRGVVESNGSIQLQMYYGLVVVGYVLLTSLQPQGDKKPLLTPFSRLDT